MKFKKLFLILIFVLVFSFFIFYKINAQNASPNNPDIENIKNLIQEKTPVFIAKPIIATTNALENFRKNTGEKSSVKREEVKKEIENLNTTKEKTTNKNKTSKYFQYAKLFFFRLVSFIFVNQFIFYIVLFTIISLIVRFIWMKIF
jgi:hypothetical protein